MRLKKNMMALNCNYLHLMHTDKLRHWYIEINCKLSTIIENNAPDEQLWNCASSFLAPYFVFRSQLVFRFTFMFNLVEYLKTVESQAPLNNRHNFIEFSMLLPRTLLSGDFQPIPGAQLRRTFILRIYIVMRCSSHYI